MPGAISAYKHEDGKTKNYSGIPMMEYRCMVEKDVHYTSEKR